MRNSHHTIHIQPAASPLDSTRTCESESSSPSFSSRFLPYVRAGAGAGGRCGIVSFKLFLMACTILPIRLLLIILSVSIYYGCAIGITCAQHVTKVWLCSRHCLSRSYHATTSAAAAALVDIAESHPHPHPHPHADAEPSSESSSTSPSSSSSSSSSDCCSCACVMSRFEYHSQRVLSWCGKHASRIVLLLCGVWCTIHTHTNTELDVDVDVDANVNALSPSPLSISSPSLPLSHLAASPSSLSPSLSHTRPPCVIVSNHLSWLDILILSSHFGFSSFLCKADIRHVPFIGRLATANGAIYVGKEKHTDVHVHTNTNINTGTITKHNATQPSSTTRHQSQSYSQPISSRPAPAPAPAPSPHYDTFGAADTSQRCNSTMYQSSDEAKAEQLLTPLLDNVTDSSRRSLSVSLDRNSGHSSNLNSTPILTPDSGSNKRTVTHLLTAYQHAYMTGQTAQRLIIFPEGATSNGFYVCHFHRGAFASGLSIQPVALSFPYQHWSPCWDSFPFIPHLFITLCQIYNRAELHILPIYIPSSDECQDPQLYANNVQQLIANTLQRPITHTQHKDKRDYHKWWYARNGPHAASGWRLVFGRSPIWEEPVSDDDLQQLIHQHQHGQPTTPTR